jgi:Clp amino terminal domain, pathogenicity island component
VFERFTDRARRVVVLAQEEARLLNHNYIGTEHLLLGLVHEGEGVAARALVASDISLQAARDRVIDIIGHGGSAPSGHIPFTPRAKKVLELALREALQLGHNYIGTEHVLLGLIREGEGVAAQVLVALGANLAVLRATVVRLLGATPGEASQVEIVARGLEMHRSIDRCTVCGRDVWDVARYVVGASVVLCSDCVHEAAAAFASSDERKVAMPPRRAGDPAPSPDELVDIQRAFTEGFAGDSTLVEDGEQIRHVGDQVARRMPGMTATFVVERVRLAGPDVAEVRFTIVVESPTLRIPTEGRALRIDGVWKVARETYLAVMARGGGRLDEP